MQLCIDAADDRPGIALAVGGVAGPTLTWETQRNHSVELLPNIDRLLTQTGRTKGDLTAVFVDVGPGGYAALRVGVSIAKALAHALGVPIVGVGRLELDAWGAAREPGAAQPGAAVPQRVFAVHRAGRGELAWAAYRKSGDAWSEEAAPAITKAPEVEGHLHAGDIVTGDVDDALADAALRAGAGVVHANHHRVVALAELGQRRLAAGSVDAATALVPMYLRAPAIGPQR
ncbi:MAG: tRNA (adenosine(37)-N6)-threonylcarbamoyltransferase complex dimerization subunit type 1 TsaB [Chloroflexi bacterium]|nr:tRNA (adenosine(37)-N6)-threonylcarbamoyltransferase complex dimerization subunit type 1 TsaB [Chloroflexota bacterium]